MCRKQLNVGNGCGSRGYFRVAKTAARAISPMHDIIYTMKGNRVSGLRYGNNRVEWERRRNRRLGETEETGRRKNRAPERTATEPFEGVRREEGLARCVRASREA